MAQSNSENPLKVLVVDDDDSTARMIKILIERAFDTHVEIALDFASAMKRFASEKFDLVTLDYQLQDGDGLDLLQEFKKGDDSPPVILVTGRGDEHVAARAFLLGASGYVIKDLRLNTMLAAAVHKALTEIALRKAEAAAEASDTRLGTILETALEGIWMADADYVTTYANQAMAEILGFDSAGELLGRPVFDFFFEEDVPAMINLTERRKRGEKTQLEIRYRRRDGQPAWVIAVGTPILDQKGKFLSAFAMVTDITERKLAEETLRIEKDRAQLYLDTAGVILVALDADGRIALINMTGQELLGYKQSDLLGKNWFDICIPERHKDQVRSTHQNMLSGKLEVAEYFENPVVTSSGEEKLIAWHNAVLKDDDGNITGTLSSGEDVTEKLKAQEDLRMGAVRAETLSRLSKELVEARLDYDATLRVIARNVADLIGDGCFISLISNDGEYLEAAAVEHSDPEARDLAQTLITPYPLASIEGPVGAALSTGESQFLPVIDQKELKAATSDKFFPYIERYGIHSIIVAPLRVKGKTIGTVTVMRDEPGKPYTEDDLLLMEEIAYFAATTIDSARAHNQLQDELAIREKREKELEAANAELKGFAHTVSHDLQGPISVINLGLARLRDELRESNTGWSTEKLDSLIEPLQSKISTCASLVESLLELAESGPIPQEVSAVEVGDIVQKCIESNIATISQRGIEVEVDPEMGRIVANPTHVYQLFSNLIGNAVIHNEAREPRLEIRHLDDSPEGVHRYLVRDNGSGIPENYLEKLFTPFFRDEGGGTVIGLAMVDKVLKAYGGEIKAYNDSGACFEFTIKDFKAA